MNHEPPVTDSSLRLFKKSEKIYPAAVTGRYRRLKWISIAVLLGIYYLAPWLRWDRGPHAPGQAILIDMPTRRAYFFFIEIWPQEVYYLMGLLILAAVGLFFATAMFGRVWCGYACPQTVWTDLFIAVERLFQGDRNRQMKLDRSPWSFDKLWRKGATHAIWILISLLTGGAWVFYFNDAPALFEHIIHLSVPWSVGGWILALTASTYLMAGFAREQVCIYMCPYARFQSAMFDQDTLIIGYDEKRGEPRGHHKRGESWKSRGHCIDCTQCVQVCPAGIDIRNGLQMECIACGLCVDACNNIMDKVGLPRGLIRYDTARNIAGTGARRALNIIRPRTLFYMAILAVVGGVMLYGLMTRAALELNILHDRNPLFVMLSDGRIRNGYTVKILNKTNADRAYALELEGLRGAEAAIHGAGGAVLKEMNVFADSVAEFRVFVAAPVRAGRQEVRFVVKDLQDGAIVAGDSIFVGGR